MPRDLPIHGRTGGNPLNTVKKYKVTPNWCHLVFDETYSEKRESIITNNFKSMNLNHSFIFDICRRFYNKANFRYAF